MMNYSEERKRAVFNKTNGKCHLCGKTIHFINYGKYEQRGAWEIDHSRPRAKKGTDHLNNLYPSCISCNRSKQANSSNKVRTDKGKAVITPQKKIGWGWVAAGLFVLLAAGSYYNDNVGRRRFPRYY